MAKPANAFRRFYDLPSLFSFSIANVGKLFWKYNFIMKFDLQEIQLLQFIQLVNLIGHSYLYVYNFPTPPHSDHYSGFTSVTFERIIWIICGFVHFSKVQRETSIVSKVIVLTSLRLQTDSFAKISVFVAQGVPRREDPLKTGEVKFFNLHWKFMYESISNFNL